MDPLDITCVLCGKNLGSAEDLPIDTFQCKESCTLNIDVTLSVYHTRCPWCDLPMEVVFTTGKFEVLGECNMCTNPVKCTLLYNDTDTKHCIVGAEKLYGGPKSVKEDGEPEWKI